MRAYVTGADGFIGDALCDVLEENSWEVIKLEGSGDSAIDLRDSETVIESISSARPDVMFHLAGVSGPMVAPSDPHLVSDVNCTGTINVLEGVKRAGVQRIVYAASLSGYDGGTVSSSFPLTVYGASKRFGEMVTAIYSRNLGISSVSARIGAVYGPGRQTIEVLDQMLIDAKNGEVRYRGSGIVPLISVRDVAESLFQLGRMDEPPSDCNLVSETLTERRLAEIVAVKAGLNANAIREVEGAADPLPLWRSTIFPELLLDEKDVDRVPSSLEGLL